MKGERREYKQVIIERKNFSFASTVLTAQALSQATYNIYFFTAHIRSLFDKFFKIFK
jgi:hypothetical protein